jgi:uncharacterized RDD family membrane protein YckC
MRTEPSQDPGTTLQPAGFVTRLVAFMIDQVIVATVLSFFSAFIGVLFQSFRLGQLLGTGDLTLQLALIPLGVAGFILGLFYYVGFWLLAGQTPGKAFLGLVVIRTDGRPLRLWPAIVRWLGYWLSGILFLGYLWVLVDNRRQAWHDKLARTLVVHRGLDERFRQLPGQVRGQLRDWPRSEVVDVSRSMDGNVSRSMDGNVSRSMDGTDASPDREV